MSTLYELSAEYLELLDMAQDPEIDTQTLADTMEAIEGELEDKADAYAVIAAELKAESKKLKAEIERLTARKRTAENNIDRLMKTLESAMIATGKRKFKTDRFSFNIQKNPAQLKLKDGLDVNDVPFEYLNYKEPEINKKLVKEAIKNGESFEWAEMVQTEDLRIR